MKTYRTPLFDPKEWLKFEGARRFWMNVSYGAGPAIVLLVSIVAVFVTAAYNEFTLLKEVFSVMKSYLPGTEDKYSVTVFALMAMIALAAYHFRAKDNPDGRLVILIERMVDLALPVYLIGVWLLLTVIWWEEANGTLINTGSVLDIDIFGGAGGDAEQGGGLFQWLERDVMPYLPIWFVCGAGAVTVLSLFVAHRCLFVIWDSFTQTYTVIANRRRTSRELEELRALSREYDALVREHSRLASITPKQAITSAANAALEMRDQAVSGAMELLTSCALHGDASVLGTFSDGGESIDAQEMQVRVDALTATTVDDVIKAMAR